MDTHRICRKNPADAWLACLRHVVARGDNQVDGAESITEVCSMTLVISDPDSHTSADIPDHLRASVESAIDDFLSLEPNPSRGWTYGQRLFSDGGNQIEAVCQRLRKKRESKSATAVTLRPCREGTSVPCLVSLDWKVRSGLLVTTAFFRSQDVFGKQLANILTILALSKEVSVQIGTSVGPIVIFICSAHVYDADLDAANELLKLVGKTSSSNRCQILVIGKEKNLSVNDPVHKVALKAAQEVGRLLANRDVITLTGGLGGIMQSTSLGVAQGCGFSVGVVPELTHTDLVTRYVNEEQTAVVHTGLTDRERIPMLVGSADGVICISGGGGAKREALLALEHGIPVAVILGTGGTADELGTSELASQSESLFVAHSPAEAVEIILSKFEGNLRRNRP